MEAIVFAITNYIANLIVVIPMACLAKIWSKEISWGRLIGYGFYFNLLPTLSNTLRFMQHS